MRMNYSDAKNVTGAGVDIINLGDAVRSFDDMDNLHNGSMAIDKIGLDTQLRLVCIAHKTTTDAPNRYIFGKDVFLACTEESDVLWANGSYDYTAQEVEKAYMFERDPSYAEDDGDGHLVRRIIKTVWMSAEYKEAHRYA